MSASMVDSRSIPNAAIAMPAIGKILYRPVWLMMRPEPIERTLALLFAALMLFGLTGRTGRLTRVSGLVVVVTTVAAVLFWSSTGFRPDDGVLLVGLGGVVGFVGGLCVRRTFYSRLPSRQGEECRALGGVAQLIMETAARELDDCDAWFAYIGDERSLKVCTRMGYRPTGRRYVMAKWFRALPPEREAELIERVAALGPF